MTANALPVAPDLEIGSFTDVGPWVVDPPAMTWRPGIDTLRDKTREQVPWLIRKRFLPGWHSVRILAVMSAAIAPWAIRDRRKGGSASISSLSPRLRAAFERLGPTFIKLGQLITSGQGLVPDELVEEFKLCQDRVPAEPFEVVRRTIEQDLGKPLEQLFAEFDPVPIAAASIAQVYAARLSTGEDVVVKVQRQDIAERVAKDLRAMAWVARHLVGRIKAAALANPPAYVELFAETISEELDFRLEAQNMLDIAGVLAKTDQRQVVCPRPHPELVTARILVMERLHGYRIDDREALHEAGVATTGMLRGLFATFFEGAVIFGVFHGDLHAGNTLVTPDGRAALFDFGITARFSDTARLALMRMMLSNATQNTRVQIESMRDLGAFPPDADIDAIMADMGIVDGAPPAFASMDTSDMVENMRGMVTKLLAHGARIPKDLMLFIKGMIYMDGAISTLAADLNMLEELGLLYAYLLQAHGDTFAEVMGFDLRTMPIDMSAVVANMGGIEAGDNLTFGEMRKLQAARQQELRDAMRKRKRA